MTSEVPSSARICSRAGSSVVARKMSQVTRGRGEHRGQDTKLGLLKGGSGEGQGRDQDGHREADAGDRADARGRRPSRPAAGAGPAAQGG